MRLGGQTSSPSQSFVYTPFPFGHLYVADGREKTSGLVNKHQFPQFPSMQAQTFLNERSVESHDEGDSDGPRSFSQRQNSSKPVID